MMNALMSLIKRKKFEDLPLKHDILSFIKDLRHSGDIIYLTDVNVDYLHQPWRAFDTIINKCLSGKETGMDKIRLSHKGTGTIPGVPNVPIYDSKSNKESWRDSDEEDDDKDEFKDDANINDHDSDDNDESDEETIESDSDEILDPYKSNDEHDEEEEYDDDFNVEEGEKIDEEDDDEVTKELYKVENFNLGNNDANITDADQSGADQQNASQQSGFEQEEEDAHLLNLDDPSPTDITIASLMDTTVHREITSTTTVPSPPSLFNPLQQEATLTPTPTTSETTTSLHALLDFAFVFKFNERVTNLEKDLSKLKQVDQYAQALSSIPRKPILNYLRFFLKRSHMLQLPLLRKNVIESLEAVVLTRSSSQPQSSYKVATTLFEFELTKILIDKMEKNKSFDVADYKIELYDALVKSYNTDKDIFESYEEPSHTVKDSGMEQDQEFVTGDDNEQPADNMVTKANWFKKLERPPTPNPNWSKRQHVNFRPPQTRISEEWYDLNMALRMYTRRIVIQRWLEDLQLGVESYQKKLNLTKPDTYKSNLRNKTAYTSYSDPHGIIYVDQNRRKRLMRADELHKFSDGMLNDVRSALHDIAAGIRMECLPMRKWSNLDKKRAQLGPKNLPKDIPLDSVVVLRLIVIQRWVEDLQLGVKSYQKKLNLTKPDTYRSNLRNKTAYTSYSDPHGIIYVDQNRRKRLMSADELHKFSDGMLNDVRSALHDIAAGIRMECMPIRKWSNLDKKRA
uniref:Uncharacterized protein n=1 Tax=Tanacetum cinerariifolium TaxID=118510 RepID=A0A6L2KUK9_TANCI|nr:hypothetical protein [Tanacetum cinerariifolium]